jgi:methionine biosynthesis protein MetW
MSIRPDLEIIVPWITQQARVLDLGCGDGTLLEMLTKERKATGYGLEINHKNILSCIRRRVNVIQTDLNAGLSGFDNNSFDYVIMAQTLQAIRRPDLLIDEMLRVGREAIITFPNFGHWRTRWHLSFQGKMPLTRSLPHSWYDTPNIHLCTIKDFEYLCSKKQIAIIKRTVVNVAHRRTLATRLFPNLLGEIALYHIKRQDHTT